MQAKRHIREIYLAGGCFWGLEKYMENVSGVIETEVGYANGGTPNPTYGEVCAGSGHAEVCRVIYDTAVSGLGFILDRYFDVIDPVSVNKQGGDEGIQYRTGVYFTDPEERAFIEGAVADLQRDYTVPLAVEAKPLDNYTPAEDYHQKYLHKNPGGYCHISPEEIEEVKQYSDTLSGAKWHSGPVKRRGSCEACEKRRR
ncbi:MAG: peptide-methionine (S)-S-oxide reductase MsrA [Defluviitaleaceae bacterium]|nr:peptide-methionine (S)-S-oxide reductase MsrA [Defluviitaleaceae bacterium]MCL2836478.1 peptide-methionine (S)-S-oxide reductase MsrA [Defluviitaleaceae bacterium]